MNANQPRKPMGKAARILISLAVTLVFGLVYFYLSLPALNLQDGNFYTFLSAWRAARSITPSPLPKTRYPYSWTWAIRSPSTMLSRLGMRPHPSSPPTPSQSTERRRPQSPLLPPRLVRRSRNPMIPPVRMAPPPCPSTVNGKQTASPLPFGGGDAVYS